MGIESFASDRCGELSPSQTAENPSRSAHCAGLRASGRAFGMHATTARAVPAHAGYGRRSPSAILLPLSEKRDHVALPRPSIAAGHTPKVRPPWLRKPSRVTCTFALPTRRLPPIRRRRRIARLQHPHRMIRARRRSGQAVRCLCAPGGSLASGWLGAPCRSRWSRPGPTKHAGLRPIGR